MMSQHFRSIATALCAGCMFLNPFTEAWAADKAEPAKQPNAAESYTTTTPIKHLVVIFGENISFDHYFATYPNATNPASEPAFVAKPNTPKVNNLLSGGLLTENPNSVQPFRLDRSQAVTCDQNHNYGPEQQAFDLGAMDKFVEFTGVGGSSCDFGHGTGLVMGYYDGNTVTAVWNYAQTYAMSDNSFDTQFGPSSPGAVNLISGNTANVQFVSGGSTTGVIAGGGTSGALIGDGRPAGDDCNPANKTYVSFPAGTNNIGVELNNASFTWGWFQGGFGPTSVSNGTATCGATSVGLPGTITDYVAHHEPFQYFPDTANLHHLAPTSTAAIGFSDQANHQYDLSAFFTALDAGQLPAVTFLKAKALYDGHPGNSDPIDEQTFLVNTINAIQANKYWKDTAIVIAYDDSDGWYDHVMDPLVNQSQVSDDQLTGAGLCGGNTASTFQGRCGYGPRTPLLVISPYARQNFVDHSITDQSSILQFIETNWNLPAMGTGSTDVKAGSLTGMFDFTSGKKAPKLTLDPTTGEVQP
ncbi:MAG TPA: alkaline phosphatase family protein [Candidatus Solibacter sp.]|nr:alkaline phosphatase family protein [Candidatus Solibacter sp.]